MKNIIYRISVLCVAFVSVLACVPQQSVDFDLDTDLIEIGPEGGVKQINVSSDDNWIATVQEPWITVSPANGVGSVECKIIIDSALAVTSRQAVVRIENQVTKDRKDFTVRQTGFDYQITVSEPEVSLASYASLNERNFSVKVCTNVPFEVVLPEGSSDWLSYTLPELNLDRGARPRNVSVNFKWNINFNPDSREALIKFNPKSADVTPAVKHDLKIVQDAAEAIEIGVKGDSLALIAINRALGCWTEYETAERMEFWDGVEIWQSGENKGRVKRAEFFMFGTKEGIPFQVKYLTAAEMTIGVVIAFRKAESIVSGVALEVEAVAVFAGGVAIAVACLQEGLRSGFVDSADLAVAGIDLCEYFQMCQESAAGHLSLA